MQIQYPNSDPHAGIDNGSVHEINEILEDAARATGTFDRLTSINWEWSTRFTSTMGDAEYLGRAIRLSHQLWPNATPKQRKHTIVHEFCHLANYAIHGRVILGNPHGWRWKQLMREAGEKPLRTHRVSRIGVVPMVRGICKCREHHVTPSRARKGLRCRRCKTELAYETRNLV